MPRGAKRDIRMTELGRQEGWLRERASFISLDGHLYLRGEDKIRQRPKVFGFHKFKCCVCGMRLTEGEALADDRRRGEWHHVKRCDCIGCSEIRCNQFQATCHMHRTPGFNRNAAIQRENTATKLQ